VALVDGAITADQFSPERLADPALLDLVARTTVVEDPALTAGYPAGIPNRVKVTLDDGSMLVSSVAFPPGHDKNPLTDTQLATKFHGLADPAIGAEQAARLWERVSRLEDDPRPHEAIGLVARE
jgi:2-methylcitrate dehydratase